jgi:DNA-binding CsgD family transcriptional regulator
MRNSEHPTPREIYCDLEFLEKLATEREAQEAYWVAQGLLPTEMPLPTRTRRDPAGDAAGTLEEPTKKQWESAVADRDRQIEKLRERPRRMWENRGWLLYPVGTFEMLALPGRGGEMTDSVPGVLTQRPESWARERAAYLQAIAAQGGSGRLRESTDRTLRATEWFGPARGWYIEDTTDPGSPVVRQLENLLTRVNELATDAELCSLGLWSPGERRPGVLELRRRLADAPPQVPSMPLRTELLRELHLDDTLKDLLDEPVRRAFGTAGGRFYWRETAGQAGTAGSARSAKDDGPHILNVSSDRQEALSQALAQIPIKAARNGRGWAQRFLEQRDQGDESANWWGFVLVEGRGMMRDYIENYQNRPGELAADVPDTTAVPTSNGLQASVQAALKQLSRDQGRVLLLQTVGGPGGKLSIREVAVVLKISESRVRKLKDDAKAVLAQVLELEGWGVIERKKNAKE